MGRGGRAGCCVFKPPPLPWPTPEGFSARGVFAGLVMCGGVLGAWGVRALRPMGCGRRMGCIRECVHIYIDRISIPPPFPPSGAVERHHMCLHGLPCIRKIFRGLVTPTCHCPKGQQTPPNPRCNTPLLPVTASSMHQCLLARRYANRPMRCSPATCINLDRRGAIVCHINAAREVDLCRHFRARVRLSLDGHKQIPPLSGFTLVALDRCPTRLEIRRAACLFTRTMSSAPMKPPWGDPGCVSRTCG